jgi:hypothetical protein
MAYHLTTPELWVSRELSPGPHQLRSDPRLLWQLCPLPAYLLLSQFYGCLIQISSREKKELHLLPFMCQDHISVFIYIILLSLIVDLQLNIVILKFLLSKQKLREVTLPWQQDRVYKYHLCCESCMDQGLKCMCWGSSSVFTLALGYRYNAGPQWKIFLLFFGLNFLTCKRGIVVISDMY